MQNTRNFAFRVFYRFVSKLTLAGQIVYPCCFSQCSAQPA